jgi:hypothetical protein
LCFHALFHVFTNLFFSFLFLRQLCVGQSQVTASGGPGLFRLHVHHKSGGWEEDDQDEQQKNGSEEELDGDEQSQSSVDVK